MFIKIYRCKLCGTEIEKEVVNKVIGDMELLELHDAERHFCDDGSVGVVEFVGERKNIKNESVHVNEV